MNDDVKGILISIGMAIGVGGAFTQAIPHGPDEWWKFAWGFAASVIAQYVLWKRQSPTADRKIVLNESERNELRVSQDTGANLTAKDVKEGGYVRLAMLFMLIFGMLAGCAFFGAVQPKNTGQGLVHTYGTAVIVTQSIPGLLASGTVKAGQARVAQDASKNTRLAIETYWDNAAILQPCLAQAVKDEPAALCDGGPGSAQVYQVIAVDINVLTQFLTQYINKAGG